jgi:hypothetical protein
MLPLQPGKVNSALVCCEKLIYNFVQSTEAHIGSGIADPISRIEATKASTTAVISAAAKQESS